ncbi:hypothetical protein GH714_040943 [Hevea brasiliensis]|uniref:ADP/ATP translocase n=1 Tax=Hevea brasiliensis TaxID=3981 RepID=A0A6A6MK35_HEVBR|nr:hypothetical protein GH714_040943 [Hevea brasiliensis]
MARKSEKFSADFVMGGMAALASKSAAPIERVKLLLQNQGEMIKRGQLKRPYMGFRDCFRRILREEGVLSFWRGNQANVIRYFPTQVALRGNNFASFISFGLCTYPAGTDARECPINGQRQFKGLLDVYSKTLSSDGIVGLYRGFGVSIMGITLYRGMYFGFYDTMKPMFWWELLSVYHVRVHQISWAYFLKTGNKILVPVNVNEVQGNFLASFLLGWCITTVSGVCAYPFDTLRRRMMLTSGQPVKYRNALHAFREIIRLEGFTALYRGVTANMLVGIAGAGVLAGYDQLHRIAVVMVLLLSHKKIHSTDILYIEL